MRIGQLSEVTGMPLNSLKMWRHKGLLPFDQGRTEAKDSEGRTWTHFTVHDAANLIAAMQLFFGHGVGWAEACEIIKDRGIGVSQYASIYDSEYYGEVTHVARAEFMTVNNEVPLLASRYSVYWGPMLKILDQIKIKVDHENSRANFDKDKIVFTSMVVVNYSHAFRIARANMKFLGIDQTPESLGSTTPDGDA